MKRMWIGLVLLAVTLAVGIVLTVTFDMLHRPLAEKLDEACLAAMAGNWDKAMQLTVQAKNDWEKARNFTAAVADHEPLEEIDAIFARLEVLGGLQLQGEFVSECAHLSRLAAAMGESQAVTWWNLL